MGGDLGNEFEHADGNLSAFRDARLQAMLAAAAGPVDWRGVSSADAKAAWAALRAWVEWFRREFVFDHRVVPPCWYRHSALVSVLAALHDHWRSAYDSLNTPAASSDWHRSLLQLEQRLRDWASRTGCTVGTHRPDVVAEYPDDSAEWAAHVAADVAARAQRERMAPTGAGIDGPRP